MHRIHVPVGLTRLALTSLLSTSLAFAHGGQYRGPGTVAAPPPGTGSAPSGGSGSGSGSQAGGAGGPGGGSAAPAGSAASAGRASGSLGTAARGYPVGDDLGRWEFWWEFGKDPFLRLRDSIYEQGDDNADLALWNPRLAEQTIEIERPQPADLQTVAKQIATQLATTADRDTASACLVALAKIGDERAGFSLGQHFEPFLQRGDQELRETAALAFGIAGELQPERLQLLHDLVHDTPAGQRLSGGSAVNERTRSFAAFGVGLLLNRSRDAAASLRLTRTLLAVLDSADQHGRNLTVATIEALGQFPRGWDSAAADNLRKPIVQALGAYYERDLGAGDQLIQAHVPTALARLLPEDSPRTERWRNRFAKDLRAGLRGSRGSDTKVNPHVAQSCVLALGSLSVPWQDENSASHAVGELLVEVHKDHRDYQTRSFATLALARMGGARAHEFLLAQLDDANKALEQPWLAVALGVEVARQRENDANEDARRDAWQRVVDRLIEAFEEARNPSTIGAIAIALGLTGHEEARDVLRARLADNRKRDMIAGYVALGLGLLRDPRAVPDLRTLREQSVRRPFVLLQSVRALGLIGDHTLTQQLTDELAEPGQTLVRLSATAAALGQIGDRRCLDGLRKLAADAHATPLARAFAVVALGSVCDKDPLPWNAAYASNVNYRAATETLTDGQSGILDLL